MSFNFHYAGGPPAAANAFAGAAAGSLSLAPRQSGNPISASMSFLNLHWYNGMVYFKSPVGVFDNKVIWRLKWQTEGLSTEPNSCVIDKMEHVSDTEYRFPYSVSLLHKNLVRMTVYCPYTDMFKEFVCNVVAQETDPASVMATTIDERCHKTLKVMSCSIDEYRNPPTLTLWYHITGKADLSMNFMSKIVAFEFTSLSDPALRIDIKLDGRTHKKTNRSITVEHAEVFSWAKILTRYLDLQITCTLTETSNKYTFDAMLTLNNSAVVRYVRSVTNDILVYFPVALCSYLNMANLEQVIFIKLPSMEQVEPSFKEFDFLTRCLCIINCHDELHDQVEAFAPGESVRCLLCFNGGFEMTVGMPMRTKY